MEKVQGGLKTYYSSRTFGSLYVQPAYYTPEARNTVCVCATFKDWCFTKPNVCSTVFYSFFSFRLLASVLAALVWTIGSRRRGEKLR